MQKLWSSKAAYVLLVFALLLLPNMTAIEKAAHRTASYACSSGMDSEMITVDEGIRQLVRLQDTATRVGIYAGGGWN